MAIWTEKTKCLFVVNSGLQYHAAISSTRSMHDVAIIIREFYQSRHAVLQDGKDASSFTFVRGRKWCKFIPAPETWIPQTISVSISQQREQVFVQIAYDVRLLCCTIIIGPSPLVKETRELRSILEKK